VVTAARIQAVKRCSDLGLKGALHSNRGKVS
jgi:hypothetical protein